MELLTLIIFCASLLICIIMDIPILIAMILGLGIFWAYGLKSGYSLKEMFLMSWQGVRTIKGVITVFILIGILTGLWRAAGTIPVIICHATDFILPQTIILMAFLLNCAVSVLMGTSFGTVATMGVISMSIANTMNIDPMWTGGAILAGIYFGDRWSAVSTSALLVSIVTETDLYNNLRLMLKSIIVPFVISCIIYLIAGFNEKISETQISVWQLFSPSFNLDILCILPAIVILLLAFFKVKVRYAMLASIVTAFFTAYFLQHEGFSELLHIMVLGYIPHDQSLQNMLSGGGIISMLDTTAIVAIASCYAGIFEKTPLLSSIERIIKDYSHRYKRFQITATASIVASAISCNQTLAIMMTNQLCKNIYNDKQALALDLEDTAVVISPLIPWCIAGAVPLTIVNAPMSSYLTAVFLYILPLYRCYQSKNEK